MQVLHLGKALGCGLYQNWAHAQLWLVQILIQAKLGLP